MTKYSLDIYSKKISIINTLIKKYVERKKSKSGLYKGKEYLYDNLWLIDKLREKESKARFKNLSKLSESDLRLKLDKIDELANLGDLSIETFRKFGIKDGLSNQGIKAKEGILQRELKGTGFRIHKDLDKDGNRRFDLGYSDIKKVYLDKNISYELKSDFKIRLLKGDLVKVGNLGCKIHGLRKYNKYTGGVKVFKIKYI